MPADSTPVGKETKTIILKFVVGVPHVIFEAEGIEMKPHWDLRC